MFVVFFFFKQKTAYDMRISDWSSDVCSSDLSIGHQAAAERSEADRQRSLGHAVAGDERGIAEAVLAEARGEPPEDPGAEHVAADAGDPPGRQVDAVGPGDPGSGRAAVAAEAPTERQGAALPGDPSPPRPPPPAHPHQRPPGP